MDNKQTSRRLIEEAWNKGNLNVLDEVLTPNIVNHDPQSQQFGAGAAGFKNQIRTYREAFSDVRLTIEQQMADGDYVVTRWKATGTNDGAFMGNPPTNRKATITGITIDKHQNGKITESWTNWDALGLMQEMGMAPRPGATSTTTTTTNRNQNQRRA